MQNRLIAVLSPPLRSAWPRTKLHSPNSPGTPAETMNSLNGSLALFFVRRRYHGNRWSCSRADEATAVDSYNAAAAAGDSPMMRYPVPPQRRKALHATDANDIERCTGSYEDDGLSYKLLWAWLVERFMTGDALVTGSRKKLATINSIYPSI